MKFEVEVEVLYIYGIEADDKHEAQIITQMNVSDHAPYLERTIASIYAEKMESENIPTEWVQRPPPGYFQQPKSNHL